MKKAILIAATIAVSFTTSTSWAYVHVDGYLRNNGTYVMPHIRSNHDGNPYNNLDPLSMISIEQTDGVFNPTPHNQSVI